MNVARRIHPVVLLGAWLACASCGGDDGSTIGGETTAGNGAVAGMLAPSGTAGAAGSSGSTGAPTGTAGTISGAAGTSAGSSSGVAGTGVGSGAAGRRGGSGSGESGRGMVAAGSGGASGASGSGAAAGSGAAGAGAAGSSSSGAGDFKPCPASGDCKILPLGDSITDGIGFSGGYRVHLFRLAKMNMKNMTYVGSKMNGPMMVDGMPFPRRHEGTSGITIGGLDGRIPMPGLNEIPHIILLHIGTNDMYREASAAPDRLGTLLDGLIEGAPDALIVVAKIIPFPGGASAVNTYNNAIPAIVQKRIDAGKHLLLIDQFTGFPNSELGDGVHPNQAGYTRMAEKWYAAISSYLN